MVQKAQTRETRDSSLERAAADRAGPFKPIAIPAVAAAVSAGASRQARKPSGQRDIPAILRQDDFVD
jgi:hypothetical protein